MDWKIFLGTFSLIFLAELGDKTQLTAMAASAGSRSLLPVFLGASAALVLSTLLAVGLGSILPKLIPLRIIRILAGLVFLVFGVIYITQGLSDISAKKTASQAVMPASPGTLTVRVLKLAAQLEKAEISALNSGIDLLPSESEKKIISTIIKQEENHLARLHPLLEDTPKADEKAQTGYHPSPSLKKSSQPLENIITAQKNVQALYFQLSRSLKQKEVRETFAFLAEQENKHIKILKKLKG